MVSKKVLGGMFAGTAIAFGGILYFTIRSLAGQASTLGCIANSPACQSVASGLSMSHIAVGFISAVFSLGVYFLVFHKDTTEQLIHAEHEHRKREEQAELLGKVMTPGERAVLRVILREEGILQSTLSYRTNLTPGRVSQVITSFEEGGLVSRKPEGRSYRIYPAF